MKKENKIEAIQLTLWARLSQIFRWNSSSREKGSAVLEAVLTVPIFMGAICTLLASGGMLFAQTQIWQCLSQTADHMIQLQELEEQPLIGTAAAYIKFHQLMEGNQLCDLYVQGGTKGIILTQRTTEDHLDLTASYYLKVPVPYFKHLGFWTNKTIHKRLFTGYVAHQGMEDASDPIVYVAEFGRVYHKTMTCSRICVRVADPLLMSSLISSRRYPPCDKCMKNDGNYSQIYVTVQGDVCHSSLACSGLKRSIRGIHLKEVGGLRPCQICGGS